MSRGLGKLQRALLVELRQREKWTTAIELTIATQPGGIDGFNETHLVSVRRALHGLRRRQLVELCHQGLSYYWSEIREVNIRLQAEVLCAWLPSSAGPKVFPGGAPPALNSKRCVPKTVAATQHLDG